MKLKLARNIILMTFIMILILSFSTTAYGSTHIGENIGTRPTSPGDGVWFNVEGDNSWSSFYNKQVPSKYKSEAAFKTAVNRGGIGALRPDGTRETLWESCQKSEYIYWYGSNHSWANTTTNKDTGKTFTTNYEAGTWYTQGGHTNSPNKYWVEPMTDQARDMLSVYEDWSNNWTGGNVVLICSHTFHNKIEEELDLLFKANSDSFVFDGSPKTVSGLHPDTDTSKLKDGHTHNAVATKTETAVGVYEVTFNKIVITDATGRVVTDEYKIKTVPGKLTITQAKVDPPEDVPPPPVEDPETQWRCTFNQVERAIANTKNTTYGREGYSPPGSPGLNNTEKSRYTPAGVFAILNRLPVQYQPLSAWNSWKSSYESGTDEITPVLNLEGSRVSEVLSEHGGVYNINKNLKEDTYSLEHCQPQERYWIPDADWTDGQSYHPGQPYIPTRYNPYRPGQSYIPYTPYIPPHWQTPAHWSPWENVGGRIVWDSWGPSTRYIDSNYQILAVNCNKSGFQSVLSSTGGTNHSLANGDGGGALSTTLVSGPGPGLLGRTYPTNNPRFYAPALNGTDPWRNSCQDAFNCTAEETLAYNDIINNRNSYQLFNEIREETDGSDKYVNVTNEDYLTFFRDNEDNEIRADIWYPRDTGVTDLESFSGDDALETYGYIYSGSPEIELTTIVPVDKNSPWGASGSYGRITQIGQQKDWGGMVNRFTMKSQWTSYDGEPYMLGLNWRYLGMGENKVPATADGEEVLTETGTYDYYWDVYCDFGNENISNPANIPAKPFVINGIKNEPLWDGPINKSIKAFFTRSVSDS